MPTVPLESDDKYKDAFAIFARRKGKKMGKLVREALDQVYGEGIASCLSFAASSGDENHQKVKDVSAS